MNPIASSAEMLIGHTPFMRLSQLCPDTRILAKLELMNPAGSAKDRAVRAMLDANQDTHPVSSFDILLAAAPFQSLMTDEEKEEFYEQLQRQFFFG